MAEEVSKDAYEDAKSKYYEGRQATAILTIKVDTKDVDTVAKEIAKIDLVDEVFLVTGDMDIIAKARFHDYTHLKEFMMKKIASLPGLKETNTLMVVSIYKENGKIVE